MYLYTDTASGTHICGSAVKASMDVGLVTLRTHYYASLFLYRPSSIFSIEYLINTMQKHYKKAKQAQKWRQMTKAL